MIGKLKKGSSFGGCIRYVTGKDEAKIIASDGVLLGTNAEIMQSFELQRQLNPRIKKPVGHIALSFKASPNGASFSSKEINLLSVFCARPCRAITNISNKKAAFIHTTFLIAFLRDNVICCFFIRVVFVKLYMFNRNSPVLIFYTYFFQFIQQFHCLVQMSVAVRPKVQADIV